MLAIVMVVESAILNSKIDTTRRENLLRNAGYKVETLWECQWDMIKEDIPERKALEDMAKKCEQQYSNRFIWRADRRGEERLSLQGSGDDPIVRHFLVVSNGGPYGGICRRV